ncbi:MAG: hypothetical protein J7493_12875 [Porphyrobacter sp.]|nr:hypothetical protein [Porphyrobacter sp.]
MAGDRIAQALARIDAAANRIEAAAQSSASAVGSSPELQRKYDALRSEAGAALAELDRLIGTLEA